MVSCQLISHIDWAQLEKVAKAQAQEAHLKEKKEHEAHACKKKAKAEAVALDEMKKKTFQVSFKPMMMPSGRTRETIKV